MCVCVCMRARGYVCVHACVSHVCVRVRVRVHVPVCMNLTCPWFEPPWCSLITFFQLGLQSVVHGSKTRGLNKFYFNLFLRVIIFLMKALAEVSNLTNDYVVRPNALPVYCINS